MNNSAMLSISPAKERQLRRLSDARAYYADAETPEQHTMLANQWLEASGRDRLPRAHYDVLRELGLKRCPGCATVKPTGEFSKNTSRRDGLEAECRACRATAMRAHNSKDPEAAKARSRVSSARYRKAHPWAVKLAKGLERAQKMGIPAVKVTEDELLAVWESRGIDPGRSYYSGKVLTDENRSLDHFDPLNRKGTMGHCVHNLFPCTIEENTHRKRGQNPLKGLKKIWETA